MALISRGVLGRTAMRTAIRSQRTGGKRSFAAGPPKKVESNLKDGQFEWWQKYNPSYGFVQKQLSPYELDPMKSLFTDLPNKIWHRVERPLFDVAPALLLAAGIVWWSEDYYRREMESHWD